MHKAWGLPTDGLLEARDLNSLVTLLVVPILSALFHFLYCSSSKYSCHLLSTLFSLSTFPSQSFISHSVSALHVLTRLCGTATIGRVFATIFNIQLTLNLASQIEFKRLFELQRAEARTRQSAGKKDSPHWTWVHQRAGRGRLGPEQQHPREQLQTPSRRPSPSTHKHNTPPATPKESLSISSTQ